MYPLNLVLLWCQQAWPTNMHDVDMAQNRVFGNWKSRLTSECAMQKAQSEEKRTFKAALVYPFRTTYAQAFPKQIVPRHNFGLGRFLSSPGSSIYVRLFLIIEIEEKEGTTKQRSCNSKNLLSNQ